MLEKDRNETPDFYETGCTRPPKSHGGIIALCLIAVIFLGGIYSAVNSLNTTPITNQSQEENKENYLQFARHSPLETTADERFDTNFAPGRPCAGFTGEALTNLDRQIYQLPKGIYITKVTPGTDAAIQGITPGDVLLSIDGTPIADLEGLKAALAHHIPGDMVSARIFRDGKEQTVQIKLSEE